MAKTKVEWSDYSWNPVTGCSKVSEGCRFCFAKRMARRLAGRYGYPDAPHHFDVTMHPDRLQQPLGWHKPRMVFVCSMSDLFHKKVSDVFIAQVWGMMWSQHQHIWQILTKRPERMNQLLTDDGFKCSAQSWASFYNKDKLTFKQLAWPVSNIWCAVSVENQATADERREYLRQTPAAIKYVSYEPALGPVDWTGWEFVDQIISGGESGPKARPSHPDWHRATRDFCQKHGIAYFFKQHGEWLSFRRDKTLRQYIGADGKRLGVYEFVDRPHEIHGDHGIARVGKKRAGRLLDGQLWEEVPE